MKALIDNLGRIAQVESSELFSVQLPQYWVECPDDCVAYAWTFDGTSFSPPPPVAISTLKAAKVKEIERTRNNASVANVIVHGRPWQADATSQQLLASAILLAQVGAYTPTEWRDADNNNMPITSLAQLVAIAGAIAYQTGVAYASSWARKAALESAATIEEIESI